MIDNALIRFPHHHNPGQGTTIVGRTGRRQLRNVLDVSCWPAKNVRHFHIKVWNNFPGRYCIATYFCVHPKYQKPKQPTPDLRINTRVLTLPNHPEDCSRQPTWSPVECWVGKIDDVMVRTRTFHHQRWLKVGEGKITDVNQHSNRWINRSTRILV